MQLRTGARLRSVSCETEAIVLRAPVTDVDLRCGGSPMAMVDDADASPSTLDPDFADGTLIGKRYSDDEVGLEVLVTRAGVGSLSISSNRLEVKQPRSLPASD